MKKTSLFFSAILIPLDYIMIVLAGVSAYFIRFAEFTKDIRPVIFELPFTEYFNVLLLVALFWIIIFIFSGIYSLKDSKKLGEEIYKIILACSTGLMLVVILIFVRRDLFDSRFIVLAGWILSILYLSITRIFIRWLQRYLYKYNLGTKNTVIIGETKTADNLIKDFSKNKFSAYKVVKKVKDLSPENLEELREYILENKDTENEVHEVIQCDSNLTKAELLKLYELTSEFHVTFKYAADLLGLKVLKTEVTELAGIPIVEAKRTTLDGWGRVVKRIFDLVVSFFLILILSPVFIITAIMIKLDSRGPVFFSRKDDGSLLYRVGQGGKLFRYFKFRSMITGADNMRYKELADNNVRSDGPLVKIENDPRVTKIGKFIRRFSIDELPELFLVFTGKMSLVGPRPHLPEEVAKYEKYHKKTLTIKPGITGLAQVSGRSDLVFSEEVKLDIYYIENWSMLLDFNILLRTPWAVLKKRQAE